MTNPIEIKVEALHKAFEGHTVLRGIDLEIRARDVVAIVGGSGCGKTVLLKHILGQLAPDRGRVLVADHDQPSAPLINLIDLNEEQIDKIHTHWGMVFQSNALFSGTVYDNLSVWLREVKNLEEDAIAPIARSSLKAVSLPYDEDFLDTETDSLSGGMSKRLAVARAIAMSPLNIFYDEPTTGLDPTSAAQIQDLIQLTHESSDDRTTIIITHDKELLQRLHPRVVMLHEGQVFFDGPFADFEASTSASIRPYFELMPLLHQGVKPDKL